MWQSGLSRRIYTPEDPQVRLGRKGLAGSNPAAFHHQAEPVAAPTATNSWTITQGLPPEAMIVNANIAIIVGPFHPLQGAIPHHGLPHEHPLRDQQIAVIAALTEGCSIRATERLTGIHRDTIMRLGVRVGDGCAALHDEMMRFVQVNRLELDELWSYVGKKQRRVKRPIPPILATNMCSSASTRPGRRSSPTASASATARIPTRFSPICGSGS